MDGGYSRTRLDFYLVSLEVLEVTKKVKYEDRLGNDFDHKLVTLSHGKGEGGQGRLTIHNSTLEHIVSDTLGTVYLFDALNNHLQVHDVNLSLQLGDLVRMLDEYMDVEGKKIDNVDNVG